MHCLRVRQFLGICCVEKALKQVTSSLAFAVLQLLQNMTNEYYRR